ncbi:energy-coupling factor transporter ATP-binding protein EcfA2 [Vogesella perlucida]|nr:energy-coupling factor transporter ATP-binding protein EcfA2 [Vogesella perlucida]
MKSPNSDIRTKLLQLKCLLIRHPHFNTILAEMESCLEESDDYPEPQCMLVTGDTGVGKSRLLETFYSLHPRFINGDHTETPVLLASLPLPATIAGFFTALLACLKAPYPDRGNIEYKHTRLIQLLSRSNTRMIILDEFQHLVERGTVRRIEVVADAIKSLINQTGLPFVLVGMPSAAAVLECSPQLAGRFPLRMAISAFNWIEKPTDFERLLSCYEQGLPVDKASGLCDEDMPARLYLATGGNFRALATLIQKAVRMALIQGCPRIEQAHLELCFDRYLAQNRKLRANPFRESAEAIELWVTQLKEARA